MAKKNKILLALKIRDLYLCETFLPKYFVVEVGRQKEEKEREKGGREDKRKEGRKARKERSGREARRKGERGTKSEEKKLLV